MKIYCKDHIADKTSYITKYIESRGSPCFKMASLLLKDVQRHFKKVNTKRRYLDKPMFLCIWQRISCITFLQYTFSSHILV